MTPERRLAILLSTCESPIEYQMAEALARSLRDDAEVCGQRRMTVSGKHQSKPAKADNPFADVFV